VSGAVVDKGKYGNPGVLSGQDCNVCLGQGHMPMGIAIFDQRVGLCIVTSDIRGIETEISLLLSS
jgi:hypothetical protein